MLHHNHTVIPSLYIVLAPEVQVLILTAHIDIQHNLTLNFINCNYFEGMVNPITEYVGSNMLDSQFLFKESNTVCVQLSIFLPNLP